MRVLIDECIPRKFKNSLPGHDCRTVPEMGLAGKENGELLALAEQQGFHIFLTMDKGIEYEQNLSGQTIAIVVLHAKSNRLGDLVPLAPACLSQFRSIKPTQVAHVSA